MSLMSPLPPMAPMASVVPVLHVAEPPPQYLQRPPLVVDCSALAGVLFQEPWMEQALQRLSGRQLLAPTLLPFELCNVALKKARRGAPEAATEGLARWAELHIELGEVDTAQTFELAQRYQLTAYDAAYLWLAAERRCPLATFDERLAIAATEHLARLG